MKNGRTLLLLVALVFLCNIVCSFAEEKKEEKKTAKKKSEFITQGEFMADLVTTFGWEKGLPPEPKDRHFQAILSGRRFFKFEAEKVYGVKTDKVAVRKHALYGLFSGDGWVSGTATPSTVHFKILIPIAGTYNLTVTSKGDGQKWQVGGKEFTVSTGERLAEAKAGSVALNAGPLEITLVLPPDGAVDCFTLDAPSLRPIAPAEGWNAKANLTRGELAEITAVLLDLDKQLQDQGKPVLVAAADVVQLPGSARLTDIQYLGKPVAKQWVRADFRGATLDIPFSVNEDGLYAIRARQLGDVVTAEVDSAKVVTTGKPYLEWVELGYFRLEKGDHKIHWVVGPNNGMDSLEITRKKGSIEDYMALSGVQGDPAAPVKRTEEDKILSSLAEKFKGRK